MFPLRRCREDRAAPDRWQPSRKIAPRFLQTLSQTRRWRNSTRHFGGTLCEKLSAVLQNREEPLGKYTYRVVPSVVTALHFDPNRAGVTWQQVAWYPVNSIFTAIVRRSVSQSDVILGGGGYRCKSSWPRHWGMRTFGCAQGTRRPPTSAGSRGTCGTFEPSMTGPWP